MAVIMVDSMKKAQQEIAKLKAQRPEHADWVRYYKMHGSSPAEAERKANLKEFDNKVGGSVIGGLGWLGRGAARVVEGAAKGADAHFREQYGQSHPRAGRKKSNKGIDTVLGGSGMFHSNFMESNL